MDKEKLNEEIIKIKKQNNFNSAIIIIELIVLLVVLAVSVYVRVFS